MEILEAPSSITDSQIDVSVRAFLLEDRLAHLGCVLKFCDLPLSPSFFDNNEMTIFFMIMINIIDDDDGQSLDRDGLLSVR